jgi:hypothetical protein
MHEIHRLRNPIKSVNWLVVGGIAAAIGVGLWWMERPASASSQLGPTTTFVTGGKYQITGQLATGVDPSAAASSIQASYTGAGAAGPQWQNVTVSISGNTYTVSGTYVGPGMSIPAGLSVTRTG